MAAGSVSIGVAMREAGWRQGSLARPEDHEHLLGSLVDRLDIGEWDSLRLIVLTQTCDLVAAPDVEPFVELLAGHRIQIPDGLYLHGRNPRRLQLTIRGLEGATEWLEVSIHDRARVCKSALVGLVPAPDGPMPEHDVDLLRRWVAKRYTRPAFPDAFNERLRRVDRKLKALFKKALAHPVTGIYLHVSDAEYSSNEPYRIRVVCTARADAWEDPERREHLDAFEEQLGDILGSCEGLEVEDLETRPEGDLTLADLRVLKRLDRDYRSVAGEPGVERPPPGVDDA